MTLTRGCVKVDQDLENTLVDRIVAWEAKVQEDKVHQTKYLIPRHL